MSDYQFDNFNDDNNDSNNDNGNNGYGNNSNNGNNGNNGNSNGNNGYNSNNGNNNYNKDNNDNNTNNSSNPGSADKVKSRKTIVAIVLVLAIIVGVILGINYFKAAGDGTLGQKVTKLRLYSDEYCEEGEGWIHADEMAKVLEPEVEIEYYKDWFTEESGLSDDEFTYEETGKDILTGKPIFEYTKVPSVMTVPLDNFISSNQNYDYMYYKSIKFKFKYDQQLKITGIRTDIAFDNIEGYVYEGGKHDLDLFTLLNNSSPSSLAYDTLLSPSPSLENNYFGTCILSTKTFRNEILPELFYKPNMDVENKYFVIDGKCYDNIFNINSIENNRFNFCHSSFSNLSFKIDSSVF